MITIEREGNGFGLKFSWQGHRGFKSRARSVQELHNALSHHFGELPCREHSECPLCRDIEVDHQKRLKSSAQRTENTEVKSATRE